MTFVIKDRVQESTTSIGLGDITLAGASVGFTTFGSVMTIGDTTLYAIIGSTVPTEWEIGQGTYSSLNTLQRDTVLANSLGTTAKIDFSAGTKFVFIDAPADRLMVAPATGYYNTQIVQVDFGSTPMVSKTFQVTISAALWAAATYVTASAYGGVTSPDNGSLTDDEYEMDGLVVSAHKSATANTIDLYVSAISGFVAGKRNIALQLF